MNTKPLLLAGLCGFFTIMSAFAADLPSSPVDPEADRLFRAASAYLTAAKAYSFKAMIESHFQSAKGSKTIGPSGSHSNLIVETFDRAARKLALRPEPIQDEWLMPP